MTALTQRYAPGGDIYAQLSADYGSNGAYTVYDAAQEAERTGDRSLIATAIGKLKYGQDLNDSTLSILGDQLYNAPLQAPIEQLSKVTENTVKTALGNWGIWVWIIGGVVAFYIWRKT